MKSYTDSLLREEDINRLIEISLNEDIPNGDVTANAIINDDFKVPFRIIAKEELISCGAFIAAEFFLHLNEEFNFEYVANDGTLLKNGDLFLKGYGYASAILKAERSALNITQRLSGIATKTSMYVKVLKDTNIKILDTRKTLPGLRKFEKYAVKVGGGINHRFSLSDMVLLKENHLMIELKNNPGNYINSAIKKCRKNNPELKVECEVRNIEEASMAAKAGADIIMLDNMTIEQIQECIKIINKKSLIEVSGGINLNTISKYAIPGIDFISIGEITHSVKAVDLSLLIDEI